MKENSDVARTKKIKIFKNPIDESNAEQRHASSGKPEKRNGVKNKKNHRTKENDEIG
jgi:hypothetical protein